jgi:DNA-binding MarR family transcriptional regulator
MAPMSQSSAERAQRDMVEFLGAVWGLYRELHAASGRMLENFGVSGPQRLVLRVIEVTPGITAGQLADAVDLHRSTVSTLIKRLETLGLVTRRHDRADRRLVYLELTPTGRRLNARAVVTIEATLRTLIEERGVAWRKRTHETLRQLSTAIQEAGRSARKPARRSRSSSSRSRS